jgi:iron(III) transport system permease protein
VAGVGVAAPHRRSLRARLDPQTVICSVALAALVIMVIYPLALVIINSFQLARPGQDTEWSIRAWQVALGDERILGTIWNTISLALARQGIALAVGILLAWLIARTDIPGGRIFDLMFWIAFFLPALPVTLGWILLLDPQHGLLNQAVAALPFGWEGPFNIYSFWGIVWVHLASGSIALKVILLTPAFRNLDASLEEASRVSGASSLGTLFRIVIPVLAPTIVVVLLLGVVYSLQTFEVEMILGLPIRFFVFSSQIYLWIHREPPLFSEATVLGSMILVLIVPMILIQRWIVGRRRYATVAGQFRTTRQQLGRWRYPAFFLVLGIALVVTVLPVSMLVMATFMKLLGFFNLPDPWTLNHWKQVLSDPIFLTSLRNTLVLASSVAVLGVFFFLAVAYISVRTSFRARSALDFIAWLPSALPGVILGLGILWMVLGNEMLRPIYGSLPLLILALLVTHMPLGVQPIKSTLVQLGVDLEEAARVSGGSWLAAMRYVIFPLMTPLLLVVGSISFMAAAKDVSTVALLATSSTRPLSLLQLDYMVAGGQYESAAVVGVLVAAVATVLALFVRIMSSRVA